MKNVWWVGLGSGLGGAARILVAAAALHLLGSGFPYGILAANLLGSALIGALAALTAPGGRWLLSPAARQFLTAGFCGGFTTFSFFSLQTFELIEAGRIGAAAAYSLATVAGSVVAVWAGYSVAAGWAESRKNRA
jgi:fluoride exporter